MATIETMPNRQNKICPNLFYTTKALKKILMFLKTEHAQTKEFTFLGEVEKQNNLLLIKDFYLVPQHKCSGVYTETDPEKFGVWMNENIPMEKRSLMRLHGHSHVDMATVPSATDNEQIQELCEGVDDYFIQLIINKSLINTINIWDKEQGLIFKNVNQFLIINKTLIEIKNIKQLALPDAIVIKNGKYEITDGILNIDNVGFDLVNNLILLEDENLKITISKNTGEATLEAKFDPTELEDIEQFIRENVKTSPTLETCKESNKQSYYQDDSYYKKDSYTKDRYSYNYNPYYRSHNYKGKKRNTWI